MSSALYALKATSTTMESTNSRLATGLKVNSALDDPLAYFAADEHTADANNLSLLDSNMSEAVQTIEAASNGLEAIKDLLDDAKALCNSALSAETDSEVTSYMNQINDILSDIDEVADDSGYSSVNLLSGTDTSLTVAFTNSSGGSSITVSGIDASSDGLNLTKASDWTTASDSTIETFVTTLTTAKTTVRSNDSKLSSQLSVIDTRQTFTNSQIETLNTGAANLVNADTNEESAKLLALQTQQSLGTNALSIASQSMQSVLNLF